MFELTREEIRFIEDLLISVQKDYAVSYMAKNGGQDALRKFNRIKMALEIIEEKKR